MRNAEWWGADRPTLRRVLSDQLHAELCRLRLGHPGGPPPWLWTDDTGLDGEDAALDSLDLLSLSAAVAEMLPDAVGGMLPDPSGGPGPHRLGAWCDAAGSLSRPPRHVTFRSSGSTAAPRRTTHRLARLDQEAAALAGLVGARQRVLSAIPAHHAYGFIHSVLLPRHIEPRPELVELRGHPPSRLAVLLRPGDLVLGHPAFWDAALRGIAAPLPPDVVGVTSSAPCPAATATDLRDAGLARLLQVYGSAETAGIGWRDDPAAPYALLPGWRRDGEGLCRDGQCLAAPDRLAWEGERFRVLGRHDGAVQVGGVNVAPGQVGATLARHPGVAQVAVRAMRPEEGARLKAFVVPADPAADPPVDLSALQAELRRFAAANLSPPECPGAYRFGPALPRNAMGKLADWSTPGSDNPGQTTPDLTTPDQVPGRITPKAKAPARS